MVVQSFSLPPTAHKRQALRLAVLFAATGMLAPAGCGVYQTARKATAGSVEGVMEGLRTGSDPVLKKLYRSMEDPEFLRTTVESVTQAVVRGTRAGLADLDADALADKILGSLIRTLARQGQQDLIPALKALSQVLRQELAAGLETGIRQTGLSLRQALDSDLTPAIQRLVAATIDGLAQGVDRALSGPLANLSSRLLPDDLIARVERLAHDTTQKAVAGALDALDTAMRGPLPESLKAFFSPELAERLGLFVQQVSKRAVEGIKQGVVGDRSSTTTLEVALIAFCVAFGVLLVLAVVALVMLIRRYKASAKALTVVAERINEADDARPLKQRIRESAEKNGIQGWLSDFLKSRGL